MKRKTQLASMLLMIAGIISFLSCKENPVDKVKTKTELLTAAPWKRTALISTPAYDWNADGTSSTDVLSIMWPCEKDNLDIYKTNGIIDTDEGPTKCNPSDPQSWTTTWMLVDNESKIRFDNSYEYILVEVSATILRLSVTFIENGVTYTHHETYGH